MELEQRLSIFGGKLKLCVSNDDVLEITHKKLMNTSSTKHLLDNIDPRYEAFRQFSVVAAAISITSLLLSAFLFWYGETYTQPPEDAPYLFFSIIALITFLIAGVKAYNSRINVVCFNSADGRRLFSILGNKPSSSEVDNFCQMLGRRIERIRYNGEISSERMADILKRHLDFLFEQKVLSEAEAKSALNRIVNKPKLSVLNFSKNEIE